MIPLSRLLLVVLLLAGVACRGEEPIPDETVPSDLDPAGVVRTVLLAVDEGRFDDTPPLTDLAQAGLLTLAEGADANDVVDALGSGEAVAANFWSGFAQTLDPAFEPDALELEVGDTITEEGHQYVAVTATPPAGDPLTFVVRREGGWRIDLMATFGPVLAERLIPPVEALLSSANTNAGVVLAELRRAAPSLRVAADSPTLAPESHQSILTLLERVTRTG